MNVQHKKHWKGWLWLAVTSDAYELPLTVAESCAELAAMIGKSPGDVSFMLSRACDGSRCGYRVRKVWGREDMPEPVTYIKSNNGFV